MSSDSKSTLTQGKQKYVQIISEQSRQQRASFEDYLYISAQTVVPFEFYSPGEIRLDKSFSLSRFIELRYQKYVPKSSSFTAT